MTAADQYRKLAAKLSVKARNKSNPALRAE